MQTEKITKIVELNVLNIGFPASLFKTKTKPFRVDAHDLISSFSRNCKGVQGGKKESRRYIDRNRERPDVNTNQAQTALSGQLWTVI